MDYGLLAGFAEGIKGGLQGYQDARARKMEEEKMLREEAFRKRQEAFQYAKEGYFLDENNTPIASPELKARQEMDTKLREAQYKKLIKESSGMIDPMQALQMRKLLREEEKAEFEQTPQGMLQKAPTELKQKLGFISQGLKNVEDYENVFNKGQRQSYLTTDTPIVGGLVSSTPIDEARVNLEEAIGRLASGGAISEGEVERFREMIPRAADDDATAKRKLLNLRREFEQKASIYGFPAETLSAAAQDKPSVKQGLIQNAGAKEKPSVVIQNGQTYRLNPKTGQYE